MQRLTDNDRHFGSITYGRSGWTAWRAVWSSGDEEEREPFQNTLTITAFGWVARVNTPNLLQPHREKHMATSWDAATVEHMGRNWYYNTFPRDYGFSLHEGFLQLFLGAQTHDSDTTQSWSKFLPWTQWRFVRKSLYDTEGRHFWTEPTGRQVPGGSDWEEQERMREAVPKAVFEFDDYDGQRIIATTHIEEWEWRFGEGWFRWLSLFRRPKVRRTLDLRFSEEVGPEKGSWKGGTLGHGIDMLPGESCEAAFRRYCDQDHRSKSRPFRLNFVGRASAA